MDWKLELHSLNESTMAHVKDAKAQSNLDLALDVRPIPDAITPMFRPTSERDEILRRVSNFKAHQEKIAREREGYYLQAKARMLVAAADPNLMSLNSRKNPPA